MQINDAYDNQIKKKINTKPVVTERNQVHKKTEYKIWW